MAVRRDTVQLNVEFITDEARNLAKTNTEVEKLTRELKSTVRRGGDVADVMRRISEAGGKVEDLDLTKVAPRALITRARQLKAILDRLPSSAPGVAKMQEEYKRLNDRLADIRQSTRGVASVFEEKGSGGLLNVLKRGQLAVLAFVAAFAGVVGALGAIIRATGLFQKFGAVLTNTFGSRSAAQKAIREVTDLADELNIPADQIIGSYVKLVNRGIKPTMSEMTKLLDLAASQGKSLDDLAEGALDAATGEFERLKEFGIRAKSQGDQVELSFKGQTTTVAKTQDAILGVLLGYGDLAGVQGAAAATSDNLAAKQEKLTGVFNRFLANIGQGGLGQSIGALIDNATDLLKIFVDLTDVQEGLTDEVKGTQAAFNLEIETLKRGNLSAESRSSLIETINTKYKDYLPSLLTEESTLGEIAEAQDLVNSSFEKKIILLAAEEQLTDIYKRNLKAKKEELELELELTAAKKRTIGAERRASNSGNTQNFMGVSTAKGLAGRAASNSLAEQALGRLNDKKQEQIDLEKEFQMTLAAAKALDLDINSILNPPSPDDDDDDDDDDDETKTTLSQKLKAIEESAARLRALADRDRINEVTTEQEHTARLGTIREDSFEQQLLAYAAFGQQRVSAAEQLRNELLALDRRRGESAGQAVGTIDEERAALIRGASTDEERAALGEGETSNDISPVESDEAEVERAEALAEKLIAIDEDVLARRITLAEREAKFRKELEENKVKAAQEGLNAIIAVLGRDEAARKKNAKTIKAFQKGQAIVSGLVELQQIRTATAAQAAVAPPGANFIVLALGAIRAAAVIAQTAVTVGKINATKFQRGGKVGTFGGKSHTSGGTQLYGDDGTHIEVERGEDFFILNRNASAERARLSALNERNGGVPFFEGGGSVFSAPNTTPTLPAGVLNGSSGGSSEAMASGMSALLDAFRQFPTALKANVIYGDITQAGDDLSTVSSAAEI
jgi:hypothetical protein